MRNRGIAGLLILVVAVLLALIIPRVLDPGENGRAGRAPLPAPPPVGACLTDDAGSGPPNWELGDWRVVGCDQPHTMEVAKSWALDDPTRLPTPGFTAQSAAAQCLLAVDTYIGGGLDFGYEKWFQPLINPVSRLLEAPISDRVNARGWTACVAQSPHDQTYSGSVGHLGAPADRPSAFGLCRMATLDISCLQPHDEEVFGLVSGFEPLDLSRPATVRGLLPARAELDSQCQQMSADLLQRSVSDWGPVTGHLEISRDGAQFSRPDEAGVLIAGYLNFVECSIRVGTGLTMSDSLVGVGTGPLPLQ